jgi:S1-C subfamily serine protease
MPEDGVTPNESDGFCLSCGHAHSASATYCSNCGTPLNGAGGEPTSPAFSPWVFVSGAVVLVLIAVAFAVLAFGGSSDTVAVIPETTTTAVTPSTAEPPPTTTTSAPASELDERYLADTFGSAVFKIVADGCDFIGIGTAFAIDENHIVTNRHVVANDAAPTVIGRDGSVYSGHVTGWTEDPDVAVIRIDSDLDTYLEWGDSDELGEGERTVCLGYPLPDHDFSVAPGVVVSFDTQQGHRAAIRSNAQLDVGSGGSPTLVADGRVAGVVTDVDLNVSGLQFVPIIIPSNDVAAAVDWILHHPARPAVDCDTVVAAYEDPTPTTTSTTRTTTTSIATTTSTTTTAPPPADPPETFYTVILASMGQSGATYDDAVARAQYFEYEFGVPMYVLDSNRYSSLQPGYWVVYVGEMTRAEAMEIAEMLRYYGWDAYAQKVTG